MSLVVCALMLGAFFFASAETKFLTLTVADVGQGDGLIIITPSHQTILVDGGPKTDFDLQVAQRLPWFDRQIDLVVSTHPDSDHLTGLTSVLQHYQVKRIIYAGVKDDSKGYQAFLKLAQDKNTELVAVSAGDQVDLGHQVKIVVEAPVGSCSGLIPKVVHDCNVVTKLIYDKTSALLTGDTDFDEETAMVASKEDLHAQVLKVAHHGSHYATSESFLQAVNPKYAVISVGANNHYGHPSASVISELKDAGVATYRTDQLGAVVFTSDGQNWSVK